MSADPSGRTTPADSAWRVQAVTNATTKSHSGNVFPVSLSLTVERASGCDRSADSAASRFSDGAPA
jgi:hypothetical protein